VLEGQLSELGGGKDTGGPKKSPTSKNALIHGVYARDILLPGENEEHFLGLFDAIRSELNPESPLEEEAVLDIVRSHWLKRRAIQAAKGQSPEGTLMVNTVELLDTINAAKKANPDASLDGVNSKLFERKPIEPRYEPADLERIIKIEAMIDSRIEKALARLARIKEFRPSRKRNRHLSPRRRAPPIR
jgi:hypothetical protein